MSELSHFMERFESSMKDVKESLCRLDDRLSSVESRNSDSRHTARQFSPPLGDDREHPRNRGHTRPDDLHLAALGPAGPEAGAAEDYQGIYYKIRDSVNKTTLQAEYKVPDAKKGIKKPDHGAVEIIGKCGKYAETIVKLLAAFREDDSVEDLANNVFFVAVAQIKYLQERYGAVAIRGTFDSSTADIFDRLQNNSLNLDTKGLKNLDTAAKLAVVKQQTVPANTSGQFSQSGPRYQRQDRRRNNSDSYGNFAGKQFPHNKPPRFQNRDNTSSQQLSDAAGKDQ